MALLLRSLYRKIWTTLSGKSASRFQAQLTQRQAGPRMPVQERMRTSDKVLVWVLVYVLVYA